MGLFENQYIGLEDKNGNPLHEGDQVRFYYKGMFCLKWADGYINRYSLNPEKYEKV